MLRLEFRNVTETIPEGLPAAHCTRAQGQRYAHLRRAGLMDEARAVWAHRSDISHGRDPWEALRNAGGLPPVLTKDQPLVQRYMACEQILRSTVLKCLTEPVFASTFQSDLSVESAYPV